MRSYFRYVAALVAGAFLISPAREAWSNFDIAAKNAQAPIKTPDADVAVILVGTDTVNVINGSFARMDGKNIILIRDILLSGFLLSVRNYFEAHKVYLAQIEIDNKPAPKANPLIPDTTRPRLQDTAGLPCIGVKFGDAEAIAMLQELYAQKPPPFQKDGTPNYNNPAIEMLRRFFFVSFNSYLSKKPSIIIFKQKLENKAPDPIPLKPHSQPSELMRTPVISA